MRQVLHELRDALRAKRDIDREQQLEGVLEHSSQRMQNWLANDDASPSQAVQQSEELLRIADAVYELPEHERIAVTEYYWQSATLAEIGRDIGRSAAAVAGLVHRGLRRLQSKLGATS
jgi:RNA polymerase sigma factor for flagellar operon FliA